MLNMGSILELSKPDHFGDFSPNLRIHVIDSMRPQELSNLFAGGEGERITVWDDGGAEELEEVRTAWETMQVRVRQRVLAKQVLIRAVLARRR